MCLCESVCVCIRALKHRHAHIRTHAHAHAHVVPPLTEAPLRHTHTPQAFSTNRFLSMLCIFAHHLLNNFVDVDNFFHDFFHDFFNQYFLGDFHRPFDYSLHYFLPDTRMQSSFGALGSRRSLLRIHRSLLWVPFRVPALRY